MEKNLKLVPIYSTRNLPEYKGKLNDYHINGHSKKINYNNTNFNTYQNLLYNRVMYGLAVFSKEEIEQMHWEKKKRVKKVHVRTKTTLNLWKQEIVNNVFQKFFRPKFINSNCEFGKEFINLYQNDIDPKIETSISFATLGITKKQIISKLIKENILPKNFHELKPVYRGLPRLLTNEMDKAII